MNDSNLVRSAYNKRQIMQLKVHSAAEAVLNTFIGFFVSLLAGLWLYARFDTHTHAGILIVTAAFTLLSVVRSYYTRRLFNWLHERGYL